MIDYIEEMMETAGVNKQYYSFKSADGNTYIWELNEDGNEKHNMYFIGKPELKQRDFTAEKQLEMIKLIIDLNTTEIGFILHYKQHIEGKNFEQALAQLTTELMKAGELDKEKVKEILEG